MSAIRIDENSLQSRVDEVLDLKVGSVFSLDPSFYWKFIDMIPDDKSFKFSPVVEGTSEYKTYGKECYKVTVNEKIALIG